MNVVEWLVVISDRSGGGQAPEFIEAQSGNVTAILGKKAILNCRVSGVGNKTVSWIRHSDTHLLTAGRSVPTLLFPIVMAIISGMAPVAFAMPANWIYHHLGRFDHFDNTVRCRQNCASPYHIVDSRQNCAQQFCPWVISLSACSNARDNVLAFDVEWA